jgi:uncharacterized membrane protein YeaQ/YmgE (transglycosylase-associated protein family)
VTGTTVGTFYKSKGDTPLPAAPSKIGLKKLFQGWNPHILEGLDHGQAWRKQEIQMSIIGWIVLGLIAGFIASKIVNKQGEGLILDIVLGVVGAIVGGFLFSLVGAQGVDGVNIYSMFVAVVGAIVVLVIYHALTGRRTA